MKITGQLTANDLAAIDATLDENTHAGFRVVQIDNPWLAQWIFDMHDAMRELVDARYRLAAARSRIHTLRQAVSA